MKPSTEIKSTIKHLESNIETIGERYTLNMLKLIFNGVKVTSLNTLDQEILKEFILETLNRKGYILNDLTKGLCLKLNSLFKSKTKETKEKRYNRFCIHCLKNYYSYLFLTKE